VTAANETGLAALKQDRTQNRERKPRIDGELARRRRVEQIGPLGESGVVLLDVGVERMRGSRPIPERGASVRAAVIAGLAALTLYNAAYMAEILRGAWAAQPREPIEAGVAFGFSSLSLFRRIVLPPLLLAAGPVIGNQIIQIVKDSAFLTIIALPELTHAAASIQSRHYVPFAAFITAVFLYWGLCLIIEAGVNTVDRMAATRR